MTKRVTIRERFIPCFCLCIAILMGCASAPKQDNTLAYVDGEAVTRSDLEYLLEIAHRREDLSTAKTLDIPLYMQKVIDDRLIVQEARRMGVEKSPEMQEKIHAYVLRESVVRLYNEEIVEKAKVTEEEIIDYYRNNYERYRLEMIELPSGKDAGEILVKLKQGQNFEEYSNKYPAHLYKKEGQDLIITRNEVSPLIGGAVSGLQPGEFSDVLMVNDNFYIVKLISREEAPPDGFEENREKIEAFLRQQKIKHKSDEYLSHLRQKASISINDEILTAIKLDKGKEERDKWSEDERLLVKVNDISLTVKDFISMVPPLVRKPADEIIHNWVDRKLVDQEALGRNYVMRAPLKDMTVRYENRLLKNEFIKLFIASKITVEDREMEEYYLLHQQDYTRPVQFKIQQITVKSQEDAQDVINSLQGGASFSWLAKRKSTDNVAERGGVAGWKTKSQMGERESEIIETLKPGDISPVLEIDETYRIIKLMEKTEIQVEEFDRVKEFVHRAVHREKLSKQYDEYVAKLREEAVIEINDEAVDAYEQLFKK